MLEGDLPLDRRELYGGGIITYRFNRFVHHLKNALCRSQGRLHL